MNNNKIKIVSGIFFAVALCGFAGYLYGVKQSEPNNILLGGYQYNLLNGYVLDVWFNDNGQVSDFQILGSNEKKVISANFYSNGVLKAVDKIKPNGYVRLVFNESGDVIKKEYYQGNSKVYKREHFENGHLIESEELQKPPGM